MVKLDITTQTVMAGRAFVQAAKALHTLYVPSNNFANPGCGEALQESQYLTAPLDSVHVLTGKNPIAMTSRFSVLLARR